MDLKFGKGFKVEQDGEKLILNLAPESETEVTLVNAEIKNLIAGEGLQIVDNGEGSIIVEVKGSLTPGASTVVKAIRTLTKEIVEQAIEKKQLNVKATDNHIEAVKEIIIKGAGKEKTRESYRPTDKQLELINEMALEPQTKDSGYVFELLSSTTDLDRAYDRMTPKAINTMVKQTPGRPFFLDHNWNTKSIVGRMIKGKNEDGKLIQWAYVPEIAKTKDFLEELFSGNINRLSIGFSAEYDQMQCSSCKNSIYDYDNCKHWPGMEDEKGNITEVHILDVKEYMETSAVGLPCLREAGMRKNAEDIEADLMAKTFNRSIFEKGGLVAEVTPLDNERILTTGNNLLTLSAPEPEVTEVSEEFKKAVQLALNALAAKPPKLTAAEEFKMAQEEYALKMAEENKSGDTIENDNTIKDSLPVELENKNEDLEQEVVEPTPEAPAEETAPVEEPTAPEEAVEAPAEVEKDTTSQLLELMGKLSETMEGLKSKVDELDKKVDESVATKSSIHEFMKKQDEDVTTVKETVSPEKAVLSMFSLNIGLEDQE